MKVVFSIFLQLILLLSQGGRESKALSLCPDKALGKQIEQLIHDTNPYINMGIKIVDMNNSRIVFERNAYSYFYPASLAKILTCLSALKKLGPNFVFETRLYKDGHDFYIQFTGDPTLSLKELQELLAYIKKHNATVQHIYVLENDHIRLPVLGEGWTIGSSQFCFGAPISEMMINGNALRFHLCGKNLHSTCIKWAENQVPYTYYNNVYKGKCTQATHIERHHLHFSNNLILEKSCVPDTMLPLKICLPVFPNRLHSYIEKNIYYALKGLNVRWSGKILFVKKKTVNAILVGSIASVPLLEILKKGMKESDNLIMGAITLAILSDYPRPLRKWDDAGKVIIRILEEGYHIDLSGAKIDDGAGLSYLNLLTPSQILELITHAAEDREIGPLFLETLAVGGKDGTLENRFKKFPSPIRLLGKTGKMTSISNLAGFIVKDGRPQLAFVTMVNGITGDHMPYKKLEEAIIARLL